MGQDTHGEVRGEPPSDLLGYQSMGTRGAGGDDTQGAALLLAAAGELEVHGSGSSAAAGSAASRPAAPRPPLQLTLPIVDSLFRAVLASGAGSGCVPLLGSADVDAAARAKGGVPAPGAASQPLYKVLANPAFDILGVLLELAEEQGFALPDEETRAKLLTALWMTVGRNASSSQLLQLVREGKPGRDKHRNASTRYCAGEGGQPSKGAFQVITGVRYVGADTVRAAHDSHQAFLELRKALCCHKQSPASEAPSADTLLAQHKQFLTRCGLCCARFSGG